MALSEAQMTDIRRYMGYQLVGTTMPITVNSDIVYGTFGMVTMSLYQRLTSLTASEENVLTTIFLTQLPQLEIDVYGSRENLDTDQAAVWYHNKAEISDRFALYNRIRLELCRFIGFKPGPGLSGSGNTVKLERA
ncbi:hypothetical protein [Herbaspirillum huttiense]|uniref:hypothetical protein n=1 Tax=Herbaspirillum huttiense TaxID=863372 RepID=UPI002E76C3CA|nr:hypothetical protein [Herbaspirillum huttiense]MEE1636342.1 hypothetical protein [Herbaspirillum huttiense NC40101]